METTTSDMKIHIIVLNATIVDKRQPPSGDWAAVTGLVLLWMPTFVLNCLLVGTIGSSVALKKIPFNLILFSLGVAHLLESSIDITISLAFASRIRKWPLGRNGCTFNALVRCQMVVIFTVQITHLLIDRVLAVRKTVQYKQQVTCIKQTVAILIAWFTSFMYALPVTFPDVVDTRPFISRYSCDIVHGESVYFIAFISILAIIGPLIVSCVCALYLLLVFYKDRKASRASVHALSADNVLRQPLLWSELQLSRVTLAILASYLLLQLPSLINCLVDASSIYHPFVKIPIKQNVSDTDVTTLPPVNLVRREVYDSPPRDTVFTWFRYLESLIFPIIVFVFRKDIRTKAVVLLTFWKPHANADLSPRMTRYIKRAGGLQTAVKQAKRKKPREKLAHYGTPVLFATSEGLYLRVTQDTARRAQSGGLRFWLESGISPGLVDKKPQFVCHVCDVWDAFDDIEDLEKEDEEANESTVSSGVLPRQRSSSEFDPPTPSDADSGVGEADSEEDSPRSHGTKAVHFEVTASQQMLLLPDMPGSRPTTVTRLPPISETLAEETGESSNGMFMKNKRTKSSKRGVSKKVSKKIDEMNSKPGWNKSTKTSARLSVMPTGHVIVKKNHSSQKYAV